MVTNRNDIVTKYAKLWPREIFAIVAPKKGKGKKSITANALDFLNSQGVYILYRDDKPFYIGKAKNLRKRLYHHAKHAGGRYYYFWNFFSAFEVNNSAHMTHLEGILIAAMPTANSARPKLPRENLPKQVRDLLSKISEYKLR
jgi:hypothetical protein